MPDPREQLEGPAATAEMKRLSRRSFFIGGLAATATLGGLAALKFGPQDAGVPWFLRRVLNFNERLGQATFSNRLAPEFAKSLAVIPKVNGRYSLAEMTDAATWRINVSQPGAVTQSLPLASLASLPRATMVTELKCVEGWSAVVEWSGVRFADFAAKHGPQQFDYVSMTTPDGGYYVGLDAASALHPQTLLCDTMNGAPLTPEHGGPLRLVIPVKYGVKNIKQIGSIAFTNTRPADFWAERGYDWYLGL